MINNVYEQLIHDYIETQATFLFGRIMNFIFKELPDNEKDLYLEIRRNVTLKRLGNLLDIDWVNSDRKISKRLIILARKWKAERREKVIFT